jgi:alpha-glucoside transport system substrate-binding protein
MVRQATFFSGFLPEGAAEEIDTFYFPSVDDSKPVLGAGILAGAFKDSPEVWALMDYVGSPEYANARQIAQRDLKGGEGVISGFLSANVNADPSLWTPIEQGFLRFMQDAEVFRFDGSDLMPADVGAGTFWTQATAMVNGEISTTAAAAAIDASWPEDS